MCSSDLEVQAVELNEPMGWVTVPLAAPPDADGGALDDALLEGATQLLRAHFLQICIVSMHQNGRDTHVRQCRVFGPRARIDVCLGEFGEDFASNKLSRYAVLR